MQVLSGAILSCSCTFEQLEPVQHTAGDEAAPKTRTNSPPVVDVLYLRNKMTLRGFFWQFGVWSELSEDLLYALSHHNECVPGVIKLYRTKKRQSLRKKEVEMVTPCPTSPSVFMHHICGANSQITAGLHQLLLLLNLILKLFFF